MSLFKEVADKAKKELADKIFDDDLQKQLVKALNDNVNIPFLSKKTEEKIFNALYDSVQDVVKKVIIDKL